MERDALTTARTVIVKIGSRAFADGRGNTPDIYTRLATSVAKVRASVPSGRERRVALVSSGAIALGMARLGMKERPREMAALQAAAAAGQGELMQHYGDAFDAHGTAVGQVLLSHADLASRTRANNASDALSKLLALGAVPIINENDAVAVDEIRFGDNDELAAMVAPLCGAELIILLSDVDGVLDGDGRVVPRIDDARAALALVDAGHGKGDAKVGRGGMESKLEAARRATLAGVHVVIASAREPEVVERVVAGEPLGTWFPGRTVKLSTRKHWIAYTLRPRGAALLDQGAVDALGAGASLLCVGVSGVRGDFVGEDAITLIAPDGREVARGLARMGAGAAARFAGQRRDPSPVLVHRDDLVLLGDAGDEAPSA